MTPKALLQGLAGLLLVAALAAGGYAAWSYDRMAKRVHTLEDAAAQLDDLQRQFAAFDEEVVRLQHLDAALREHRASIRNDIEKAAHEDPDLARYLGEPIPQRLRDEHLRPRP